MVEHAIQDNAHAQLIGMLDQVVKILLRAEVGIDLVVILCVVAVVGTGVEDRIKVKSVDAQRGQIIQVLIDALQVAAEVIAAAARLPWWDSNRVAWYQISRGSW